MEFETVIGLEVHVQLATNSILLGLGRLRWRTERVYRPCYPRLTWRASSNQQTGR
jgi:hypothetical protein